MSGKQRKDGERKPRGKLPLEGGGQEGGRGRRGGGMSSRI